MSCWTMHPSKAYQGFILGPSNNRPGHRGPGPVVAIVGFNRNKKRKKKNASPPTVAPPNVTKLCPPPKVAPPNVTTEFLPLKGLPQMWKTMHPSHCGTQTLWKKQCPLSTVAQVWERKNGSCLPWLIPMWQNNAPCYCGSPKSDKTRLNSYKGSQTKLQNIAPLLPWPTQIC